MLHRTMTVPAPFFILHIKSQKERISTLHTDKAMLHPVITLDSSKPQRLFLLSPIPDCPILISDSKFSSLSPHFALYY